MGMLSNMVSEKGFVDTLSGFNQLVLQCQDDAYTLACYLLGNEAQAEAVTQVAVAAAYRQYSTSGGNARLLILGQVVQACLRQSRLPIPVTNHLSTPDPIRTLQALTPAERQALALIDILGLSYAEAAAVVSRPVKDVGLFLAQARKKLG